MSRYRYRHESFREAFPALGPPERTMRDRMRNLRALRRCGEDEYESRRLTRTEWEAWCKHLDHDDHVTGVLVWSSRQWAKKMRSRLKKSRGLPGNIAEALKGLARKGLIRFLYIAAHDPRLVYVNSDLYRYGGRITVRCVENREEFRKALDTSENLERLPARGERPSPPAGSLPSSGSDLCRGVGSDPP